MTIIIITAVLFVFQQFAGKISEAAAGIFNYSKVDADNIFAFVSVHHIFQMLIALLTILILNKITGFDFYLKFKYSKIGVRHTLLFTLAMLFYVLLTYTVDSLVNSIASYSYPLNTVNVLGTLGFQLLLSGPSEEILFRALPVVVLVKLINCSSKKDYFTPIICSSLLFSLAHINWTVFPFTFQANWFQLLYAFVLGAIYAITYIKSKSIIYPMIMHSMSNVLMIGIGYLFAVLI